MEFRCTKDEIYFLYDYFPLGEKEHDDSKRVYHVFKKGYLQHYNSILNDFCNAFDTFFEDKEYSRVCVCVVPSHKENEHGLYLIKLADDLCRKYGMQNYSTLVNRCIEKQKSTNGGERTVSAHLKTLELKENVDFTKKGAVLILDDITTTGASLNAAKEIIKGTNIPDEYIYKIALAKTY